MLDEVRISKSQKEKSLQTIKLQSQQFPIDKGYDSLISRQGSQQKEESLTVFNQQKFSHSYARLLSTTNHSYISLSNKNNPQDLSSKIEGLLSDYKKVLHIIGMEKANEVSIRNRIHEISKSSIQINREITKLKKNIGEIEQRFGDVSLLETIAEQKKVLNF